ncbi:glycosyltransferase family 2 protein [Bradyrhizobium genosp. L]|uniref:glycosyltransferase family 2 protein n=1 Tax=Bradyrhizobium genosp. L TaxID=83637 RepID=UPI0018A2E601|nr:glycosyltransferase [Bradyrhizobium genosp. L]QPF85897.1 glycosyltransferase family 2 protein [Bradyrhizobium genosp. L]
MNEMSTEFPAADRAWVTASPALDCSIETVICIPSFRRPKHLRLTLDSLVAQRTARRFAVVVVENDASRCESAPVAAEFLNADRLHGLCIVEPRQGNCQAINAAFETALETFPRAQNFLMIDDDEVASPDWLERMVQAAETSGAAIIGGPVWPNFDAEHKGGLKRHPAFAPAYHASGPVPVIYGCGNCLIRRAVFERLGQPAFDLRFNFLGGGDHDFFARARRAGFGFFWVTEAAISETVPESRTHLGWIVRRGLRIGAINYHIESKAAQSTWSRAAVKAKMFGLVPFSFYRFARIVLREHQAVIAMHPMVVAIGSALAVLGIEPQPYAASKITS